MSQDIKSTIESLLFVASKPLKLKELCKFLDKTSQEVKPALEQLITEKQNTGVVVLDNGGEYQLATNSANSTAVKNFLNAELREKLTDATVEVLGIIAYRQPISKAEIEAIRGVNSQYSIRHLTMRGLIEKVSNPNDARSFLYQTTTEFLQHLGLSSVKDLPEFDKLVEKIQLPETQGLANSAAPQPPQSEQTENVQEPAPLVAVSSETENIHEPAETEKPAASSEAAEIAENNDDDEEELDDEDDEEEEG